MVTSNYGKLSEYDNNKEDWQSYVERLELFFTANEITDEEKRKAILLTSCRIECYGLFKGLTTPRKPIEKTFNELVTLMTNHENQKRNPIAERFDFNMRNRKLGESISQYMVELIRLSQYCEYGDSLECRLVCGVNHDRTQQRLLSEGATLTLQKAMDISLSLESAIKQSAIIQNESNAAESVSKTDTKTSPKNQYGKCYRCAGQHNPKVCSFIDKECFFCKNKGHTSKVCRKKAKSNLPTQQFPNVISETTDNDNSDDDLFSVYQLDHQKSSQPIIIMIMTENQNVPIEIDTGASISFINWDTFKKINCKSNIILSPTSCKLKTYSGEIVHPKGQCEIEFSYENKKLKTFFLITDKKSPNVLGRDILGKLRLNWEKIFQSYVVTENCISEKESLNKITSEYESVFSNELGILKNVEVEIPIQPNVNPKFFRACPVPYSLKDKIEKKNR